MKILLPLDGSELSEAILPWVAELARRWQAEVLLLRAIDPFTATTPALQLGIALSVQEKAVNAAEQYLDSVAKQFPADAVKIQWELGAPREQIVETAARKDCQLIVMASHGRSGPTRWLLGSVAEGVLRQARCPVLLLRPPSIPATAAFQHILVPVDGSEASKAVVERVSPYLAGGGQVTILRSSGATLYSSAVEIESEVVQEYFAGLERELRQIVLEGVDLKVSVVDGEAAESILAYAREHQVDLIAMSTHGRSGFRRFWLGSVTEKVARNAPCPVLAFPGSVEV
ncbi:universal stress protein [bacterium]|nr:universal stress protein [bacterium]